MLVNHTKTRPQSTFSATDCQSLGDGIGVGRLVTRPHYVASLTPAVIAASGNSRCRENGLGTSIHLNYI